MKASVEGRIEAVLDADVDDAEFERRVDHELEGLSRDMKAEMMRLRKVVRP